MNWAKIRDEESIKTEVKIKRKELIDQWYKLYEIYAQKCSKFFRLTEPIINQIETKAFDEFKHYFAIKNFNVKERTCEHIAAITGEVRIEFKRDAKNLYGIYYYKGDNLNKSVSLNIGLAEEYVNLYKEKYLDPISEYADTDTANNQLNDVKENIKAIENKIKNIDDLKFIIKADNYELSNSNNEFDNIGELLDVF